ncbi:MAG: NADH-quinone oxidoreductase subunit D [Planctomycetota bacterium]|nr:MAG: NADH-quinone oxidoreductase subunit D [Planctomycetota bacterium]
MTTARALDVELAENPNAEAMLINMGPQHPSTHGVLRLILELDGEEVVKAAPDIGFLHRGKEKVGEAYSFHKFIPYTDRLDYLAPLSNNVGYALACEKLFDIECPPRATAIRVIAHELSRISAHLLGLGAYAMDLGAMTVFLWTFREREHIYGLIERICGARFTTSYTRIGGVERDLPADFFPRLAAFLEEMPRRVDEYDAMLTRNRIWVERTQGVGVITREQCLQFGLTGPILRASGVDHDIRKSNPYLGYEDYDFDVPIGTEGDCYDRYMVRLEEMRQSVRIMAQVLAKLPDGPVMNREGEQVLKSVLPEKGKVLTNMEALIHQFMVGTDNAGAPDAGEVYFSIENPKGELGFYLRSDGGHAASRLRIRGPSFANLQILEEILPGHMVSDVMAILGSLDFVMGECDR